MSYFVNFLSFHLYIVVLNVDGRAPEKGSDRGEGSFGRVRTEAYNGRSIVVKRQRFRDNQPVLLGKDEFANREELNGTILEVAIAKLCSFYEIGPKFETDLGFDLVCFSDCTEFHMELCEPAHNELILGSRSILESSLRTMHSIGLIHKDIKPSNILFSPSVGKCVFIDFGISHFVVESHRQKSPTFYEGTPYYLSP